MPILQKETVKLHLRLSSITRKTQKNANKKKTTSYLFELVPNLELAPSLK